MAYFSPPERAGPCKVVKNFSSCDIRTPPQTNKNPNQSREDASRWVGIEFPTGDARKAFVEALRNKGTVQRHDTTDTSWDGSWKLEFPPTSGCAQPQVLEVHALLGVALPVIHVGVVPQMDVGYREICLSGHQG